MNEKSGIWRVVIIDDVVHDRDIESSSSDVGDNQDLAISVSESMKLLLPSYLIE
jgi:hypothetical protein